ncbi:TPA: IS66 family insertion sequence element accessory protein TnpB, partial [Escherichia coli]|nr:IS66 family insertion sequence element accessory protein TnpB [Escherichia coli]
PLFSQEFQDLPDGAETTLTGDTIKILWADADGLCLFTKRLEEGQFIWPTVRDGKVSITRSQLAMLLDKLDWHQPKTSRLNALTML